MLHTSYLSILKLKPSYYVDYTIPEVNPVIDKELIKKLNEINPNKLVKKEVKEKEIKEIKQEEIKEEVIEVPEELDQNAPFRKSKYIVDDSDEE